jgi:hypothetical protein
MTSAVQHRVPPAALINAMDSFLRALAGSPVHNLGANGSRPQAVADALYEAYVYTLVGDALENLIGAAPNPMLHAGEFRVRRGPGELHSSRGGYSYLSIKYGNTQYELHLDTYVGPRATGAKLEVDILLVTKASADRCRRAASGGRAVERPKFRSAWLVLECKYLSDKVGTTLATAHLGRWQQLGRVRTVDGLISNAELTRNANAIFSGCARAAFPEVLPVAWAQVNEAAFVLNVESRLRRFLP